MKSSTKKRMTAPERRASILASALTEFARSGYEGASMEMIATTSGISKPVLYDHFPSKQRLFEAVLASVRDRLLALGGEAARMPDDHAGRFRSAIAGFFTFVETHPDATRVLLLVPYGATESLEASRAAQTGASAGIAALLHPILVARTNRDIEAAAEFLKRGLHALAEWWLDHQDVPIAHMIELGTALAWAGVGGVGDPGPKKPKGKKASRGAS